uniref:Uncharacterized protein n=1 Tax=Micrurus carvalhoi TaxID=3147026 RepID=A0A2H6N690_9SAUR
MPNITQHWKLRVRLIKDIKKTPICLSSSLNYSVKLHIGKESLDMMFPPTKQFLLLDSTALKMNRKKPSYTQKSLFHACLHSTWIQFHKVLQTMPVCKGSPSLLFKEASFSQKYVSADTQSWGKIQSL